MTDPKPRDEAWPVPQIDPDLCNGCGLCVQVCPTSALALRGGLATVARPRACEYQGYCELVCPTQAIERPFQFVLNDGSAEHRGLRGGKQK